MYIPILGCLAKLFKRWPERVVNHRQLTVIQMCDKFENYTERFSLGAFRILYPSLYHHSHAIGIEKEEVDSG